MFENTFKDGYIVLNFKKHRFVELNPIFVTVFTESALQTIYNKEIFCPIHIYSGVIVLIYLLMFSLFFICKEKY